MIELGVSRAVVVPLMASGSRIGTLTLLWSDPEADHRINVHHDHLKRMGEALAMTFFYLRTLMQAEVRYLPRLFLLSAQGGCRATRGPGRLAPSFPNPQIKQGLLEDYLPAHIAEKLSNAAQQRRHVRELGRLGGQSGSSNSRPSSGGAGSGGRSSFGQGSGSRASPADGFVPSPRTVAAQQEGRGLPTAPMLHRRSTVISPVPHPPATQWPTATAAQQQQQQQEEEQQQQAQAHQEQLPYSDGAAAAAAHETGPVEMLPLSAPGEVGGETAALIPVIKSGAWDQQPLCPLPSHPQPWTWAWSSAGRATASAPAASVLSAAPSRPEPSTSAAQTRSMSWRSTAASPSALPTLLGTPRQVRCQLEAVPSSLSDGALPRADVQPAQPDGHDADAPSPLVCR